MAATSLLGWVQRLVKFLYDLQTPRVGLVSIGEEPEKGNQLVKDTHRLLAEDTTINFIGNVEGRDVLSGDVDVLVADGFTGNVIFAGIRRHSPISRWRDNRCIDQRRSSLCRSGGARSSGQ